MSEIPDRHKAEASRSLRVAVVTVSDTRTEANDTSGALIVDLLRQAGHEVVDRRIIPDDPVPMLALLSSYRERAEVHAAILTGGTGIAPRDQTFETVSGFLTKILPGFGELFRMLSYAEIGPSCLMSRTVAGLSGDLAVLALPGSRAGVELAMTRIVLPELPHIVQQARKH